MKTIPRMRRVNASQMYITVYYPFTNSGNLGTQLYENNSKLKDVLSLSFSFADILKSKVGE